MALNRSRRLILHIGLEKTGTTSIQKALSDNRDSLECAGFHFPVTPGKRNHTHLVVYAQDDEVLDNIRAHVLSVNGKALEAFRANFYSRFRREIELLPNCYTTILSSELIHSRLITSTEVVRLFELIEGLFEEIRIIVFLRRQDELAISRFSSALRSGHQDFDSVFEDVSHSHYLKMHHNRTLDYVTEFFDFRRVIERFLPFVGKDAISVLVYPDDLDGRDSAARFAQVAGLPEAAFGNLEHSENRSMSAEAQFVLSRFNRQVRLLHESGERNKTVRKVQELIEREVVGKRRLVARNDAMRFLDRFRQSNEWVRREFFPEREQLFSNDLLAYPDEVDYREFEDSLSDKVTHFVSLVHGDADSQSNQLTQLRKIFSGFSFWK